MNTTNNNDRNEENELAAKRAQFDLLSEAQRDRIYNEALFNLSALREFHPPAWSMEDFDSDVCDVIDRPDLTLNQRCEVLECFVGNYDCSAD